MANKHKRKKSNLFLIILFIVAAVVVATILITKYVDFDKLFNQPAEPTPVVEKPTPAVEPAQVKEPGTENPLTPTQPAPEPENKTNQYDGGNPNQESNITGAITYAGVSGDNVIIRVNIDQYLNGGTCNLILIQNGESRYGAEARIIDSASTSTCEGFNVPVAALVPGKYQIQINLSSERKTGSIMGEVNL